MYFNNFMLLCAVKPLLFSVCTLIYLHTYVHNKCDKDLQKDPPIFQL